MHRKSTLRNIISKSLYRFSPPTAAETMEQIQIWLHLELILYENFKITGSLRHILPRLSTPLPPSVDVRTVFLLQHLFISTEAFRQPGS